MTEIQVIKILFGCVAALGVVLVKLDRENDSLRAENKELRRRLGERK